MSPIAPQSGFCHRERGDWFAAFRVDPGQVRSGWRWCFAYIVLFSTLVASVPVAASDCRAHRGAGVLPYAVDESGRYQVLLGYEPGRGWTGFGGGPRLVSTLEPPVRRCESRPETALREGLEETRRLFTPALLQAGIAAAARYPVDPQPQQFQTFFVRVDLIDTAGFYQAALPVGRAYGYDEKSQVAWIPLQDLVDHALDGETPLPTPNGEGLWDIFQTGLVDALLARGQDALFP